MYPDLEDPSFIRKISSRSEFRDAPTVAMTGNPRTQDFCNVPFKLAPRQFFVRNFLSPHTPYNGLLLYHGLGTGKTCSAISIAEEFRETGGRIFVVGNDAVQSNFRSQLFDENDLEVDDASSTWYLRGCSNTLLEDLNPGKGAVEKSVLVRRIRDLIDAHYTFIGYDKLKNEIRAIVRSVDATSESADDEIARRLHAAYDACMFVVDEVHHFLSDAIYETFQKVLANATVKLLLLSATPMFGTPHDIVRLLNLLHMNDKRPIKAVNDLFDGDDLRDEQGLKDHMRGYVSFVKGENPFTFPYRVYPKLFNAAAQLHVYPQRLIETNPALSTRIDHVDVFAVKLSAIQAAVYKFARDHDQIASRAAAFKTGSLMSLTMSYPGNQYGKNGLRNTMRIVNGAYRYRSVRCFDPIELPTYSAKLASVVKSVQGSKGISMIYSRFISGGAIPAALALEAAGYRRFGNRVFFESGSEPNGKFYAVISGDPDLSPQNNVEVQELKSSKNSDGSRIQVVILTDAGSEGVDFKNVRQIHILDPWWHMERIEQIIGRGIRYCSHKQLPFEERNAMIFLYVSILPDDEESIDMFMYRSAETKAVRVGRITRLLKTYAIDCRIHAAQNSYTAELLETKHVRQRLSNGLEIRKFPIGDVPHTSACDYLDSCVPMARALPPREVAEAGIYSELGAEITGLFRTSYVLERDHLVDAIQLTLPIYTRDQILETLSRLIQSREPIYDRLKRRGFIVNKGTSYFYQPANLPDVDLSMYERRVPPVRMPTSVIVAQARETPDKQNVVTQLEQNFHAARSAGGDGWADRFWRLTAALSLSAASADAIAIAHYIELLTFEECTALWRHAMSQDHPTAFDKLLQTYFKKKCYFRNVYVFWKTSGKPGSAPVMQLESHKQIFVEKLIDIEQDIDARMLTRNRVIGACGAKNRGSGDQEFKILLEGNAGVVCTTKSLMVLKKMFDSNGFPWTAKTKLDACMDMEILLRVNDSASRCFFTPLEYARFLQLRRKN